MLQKPSFYNKILLFFIISATSICFVFSSCSLETQTSSLETQTDSTDEIDEDISVIPTGITISDVEKTVLMRLNNFTYADISTSGN